MSYLLTLFFPSFISEARKSYRGGGWKRKVYASQRSDIEGVYEVLHDSFLIRI